jgi:hypothetical protein
MKPTEKNNRWDKRQFQRELRLEGETKDAGIEFLRKGQIKNFLLTLLVSRGVPMLLGGDEFAARKAATTTPTARTTKPVGLTGATWNNIRRFTALPGHDRLSSCPSDSEQGAILHGRRDPLVWPARRPPNLGRPEVKSSLPV